MKRLQLTDEEVRHIEQRRMMENRFNLGWNAALIAVGSYIENGGTADEDYTEENLPAATLRWIYANKKVIRP